MLSRVWKLLQGNRESNMAIMQAHGLTRRDFLSTAAVGLAISGTAWPQASAEDNPMPIVDTHLHCFAGSNNPRFPYHERAPYRPEQPATPQHLLERMDQAGVDFAIVVHPEPYQDDHRYLEYCLQVGQGRLKGTCLYFADRPGSVSQMPALVKRTDIVAARIHAYAPDRLPPFSSAELKAMWKQIGELGLAVQLHFEPRYAPGFEPLIDEFRDIPVLVDHLGRPFQGTPQEHERVVRWSRFDHVIMKLSSLPSTRNYPHRDPTSIVRTLVKAFGAERLMYGGGYGAEATGDTYRAARERLIEHLSDLSAEDQAKVLGGNAAKLFQFQ